MSRLNENMLLSFQDELEKIGAIPGLQAAKAFLGRQGGAIGTGAGIGSLVGGVAGAGKGAYQGYQQAREEGASRAGAAFSGLGQAFSGGMRGMGTGLAVGAGLGALSGERGRLLAQRATGREGILGGAARFGQRQLHGFTGWTPEGFANEAEALKSIRGGTYGSEKRLQGAMQKWEQASQHPVSSLHPDIEHAMTAEELAKHRGLQEQASKVRQKLQAKAQREVELAQQHHQAVSKSVGHGMTSIPGMAKALAGPNRWEAIKAGVGAGWHGDTPTMKALNVVSPIAMGGLMVATAPEDRKGEAVAGETAATAAGLLSPMTVMPMYAGQALGRGAGAVGRLIGRGASALRGKKEPPLGMNAPMGQSQLSDVNTGPVEYNYSNSAMGRPPEGMSL